MHSFTKKKCHHSFCLRISSLTNFPCSHWVRPLVKKESKTGQPLSTHVQPHTQSHILAGEKRRCLSSFTKQPFAILHFCSICWWRRVSLQRRVRTTTASLIVPQPRRHLAVIRAVAIPIHVACDPTMSTSLKQE